MRKLGYPEKHYLNSALGWLELGNPIEAKSEADRIPWLNRFQPDVFLVRWRIHARLGNWEAARDLARIFTRIFPDCSTGWLCLSYSLFKLKRPLEAFLQLLRQAKAFPNISAIPYFLGCYSWELGDYRGAGKWLGKFKTISGGKEVKPGPFEHTELVALWDEITAASALPKTSRRRGPIALA